MAYTMKDDLRNGLGQGPIINPLKYETIKCDKCGNETFEEKYILKKIPGLAVGTGKDDMNYPVPVLVCSKCGTIEKTHRELIAKGEKYNDKAKQSKDTTLII